jgi:hypothetical protein
VLVRGEPGVGKTRLADELVRRHPRGVISLSARAHPLAAAATFGLWADGLEPILRPLPADEVARLCGGFLDDLAVLLHSVASARGSAPEKEPPRLRVLGGLARLLETLARDRPVIAVLDDAHLADASSWEALRYLARHLAKTRLCVVVTARTAELFQHEVAAQVLFELDQDEALLARFIRVAATGLLACRSPTHDRTDRKSGPAASHAHRSPPMPPWHGAYRLREHRVGIIDYQQDPARRTPNRLRAEPRPLRPARRNPECRVSDRELRDDVISLPHTVKDPGTEGRLVERDSRISVVDPQFRLDTRHAGRG